MTSQSIQDELIRIPSNIKKQHSFIFDNVDMFAMGTIYKCNKCGLLLLYKKYIDFDLYYISDGNGWNLGDYDGNPISKLSCDELLIKNIIE